VEGEYWAVCKQRGGEFCQAYLDTYPQGAYARLAKAMLEPKREALAPAGVRSTIRDPAGARPVENSAGEVKVNPKDGLTYVWIPPGRFMMGCSPGDGDCEGDEKPAHDVAISKGFWLGQTPVTRQAYLHVTGMYPSLSEGADIPAETVNWDNAQA
jgi:formylglycine-generating enzyme required for sulfatase activity